MPNNHSNNPHPLPLLESLEYQDLKGLLKPTIHVDEFASKMGDDDDVIVLSFFVRDPQAAKDLMLWFEKGYDFVLDADKSPGEIKPNRYLVYVELRRRSTAGANVERMLEDLNTLTEFDVGDWTMHYKGESMPFSQETFNRVVPLTPKEYRLATDEELNEMRSAAGIRTKRIYDADDRDLQAIQSAAGIR